MLPVLIFIIILIVILIYESSSIKSWQKTKPFYIFRRQDGKYVVAITRNPDEREYEFLVLRYDKRIEVTFAVHASWFKTVEEAKKFGQQYIEQDPRRFTPASI